jgi:hypothetical protein
MLTAAEQSGRTYTADEQSPEIVLVDPELAVRARERLRVPEDTLARLEREIARERHLGLEEASDAESLTPTRRAAHPHVALRPRIFRRRRPSSKYVLAFSIAGALVFALLLGVNVDVRGIPAGADSRVAEQPATENPARTSLPTPPMPSGRPHGSGKTAKVHRPIPSKQRSVARGAAPRRFAWAPVPDASAYHVEFFRKDVRIYAGDTRQPQLDLPRAWRSGGRTYRLTSGTYRWYVWPIVSGVRQSQATVQADLAVP